MKKLCDKYVPIKVLGEGTYGKIFQAKDKYGRLVAIKQFKNISYPEIGIDTAVLRELDVLSRINHPNVIKAVEIIANKRQEICAVLEYAEMDMNAYLTKYFRTSHYDPMKLFAQIACGLSELHANDIIHGDLKFANCLVQNDVVKISDLDVLIAPNIGQRIGLDNITPMTTIWYRAPEIFLVNRYKYGYIATPKIDMWALGVMLHTLYSGTILTEGYSEDGLADIIKTRITDYREGTLTQKKRKKIYEKYYKGIPKPVLKLIFSLLETDPEKRPDIIEVLQHPLLNKYNCETNSQIFANDGFIPTELDDKTMKNRQILIKWLYDVLMEFKYPASVFFVTVDIFDRMYDLLDIRKKMLQLYGIVSFMIAVKLLTMHEFMVKEAVYVTADSFTNDEIIATEWEICKNLGFKLYRRTLHNVYPKSTSKLISYLYDHRCGDIPEQCDDIHIYVN